MDNLIYLLNFGGFPAAAMMGHIFRIVLATAGVALLAYYVTKMLALSRGRAGRIRGGNLQVVESIATGAQSMIQLIKAGDKYLVVGITKERVTLLAELSKEEVSEPEAQEFPVVPFNKVLSRFLPQAKDGQREEDSE